MIYQGNERLPVREAVLHCAAIKDGQFAHFTPFQAFVTVNQWHLERGFNGFGYHGLFMPDGSWFPGRPFEMIGAHVKGHNTGTLGFLLIESRQITDMGRFEDFFTEAQRCALTAKLAELPGLETVSGHNDYAPKLCPGLKVRSEDWL